jgi:hypothetical protein
VSEDTAAVAEPRRTRLLRVAEHIRTQNWTAIGIDFLIVVLGVFVGIQVANWNTARVDHQREQLLLGSLRTELAQAIAQTETQRKAFEQVARSGGRGIRFLDAGKECGDDCWPVIVDFFHASQWQQPTIALPTYDELRRNGWPRNREIVDALEAYRLNAELISKGFEQPPAYRSRVRGLIPLAIHPHYWRACFQLTDQGETYLEDCEPGVPPEVSAAGVAAIAKDPQIHHALTEWAGYTSALSESFLQQNELAERTLALIDAERVGSGAMK